MQYNFKWDINKAASNIQKHEVSFSLASQVFTDPMALTIFDSDHSNDFEDRWITLGQVQGQHYLVVVHTFLEENSSNSATIRIISARKATKHEIKQYEQW